MTIIQQRKSSFCRTVLLLIALLGSSCRSENVINVTYGCVRPSDDDRSWYDARNQCLKNGGDLAVLKDADLGILRNLSIRRINDNVIAIDRYWIGLRNNTWRWIGQVTVPSDGSYEEIEYSNWSNDTHHTSYDCISIDASNGQWKAVRCTDKMKVVCERTHMSSSTTSSTKRSSVSRMSSKPTPSISQSTTQTMAEGHSNAHCNVLLTAVVVVGLCVIVISDIIVALIVRNYYLRRANASSKNEAIETKLYHDLETTRRQANPDGTYTELQLQPVYEEVSKRGH